MTKEEVMQRLERWKAHYLATQALMHGLNDFIGIAPEGKLHEGVWRMFDDYTEALSEAIEGGDSMEWLNWFAHENNMGSKCMRTAMEPDGERLIIATLDELYDLLFRA